MKRDLAELNRREFDLCVVGGGITGACVAWDAALRGLSVALIEKGDFGEATSSASSKLIHGGIRYLQQGQFHKVRESIQERKRFRAVAPHLLRSVPFLVPTYGHGMKGKPVLVAGMSVYEALGLDQNRSLPDAQAVARFEVLSRDDVRTLEPLVRPEGLTGGVVFPEFHMHSAERMTLGFVRGAVAHGATAANYVQATGFLGTPEHVTGVRALDHESGDELHIRAKLVANVAGPWVFDVLARRRGAKPLGRMSHSKGCHVVLGPLTNGRALALATRQENESIVNRGGRHIFLIPWRGRTLVGTTNVPHRGEPDDLRVTEKDVVDFAAEIGTALHDREIRPEDVQHAFGGLYPLVDTEVKETVYQGSGEYRIWDHAEVDGVDGLVSVLGAKFTTALRLAEKAVDGFFRRRGQAPPPCRTDRTPVPGGDVESAEAVAAELRTEAPRLDDEERLELARMYGGEAVDMARRIRQDEEQSQRVSPDRETIRAAVWQAAEHEMATKLADVVFRRTGLGTIGDPGSGGVEVCAEIMSRIHGWTPERTQLEVGEVRRKFQRES